MTISSLLTPELVLPAPPVQAKAQVLEALAAHVGLVHPDVDVRRRAAGNPVVDEEEARGDVLAADIAGAANRFAPNPLASALKSRAFTT